MNLDPWTFGSSPASQILVERLNYQNAADLCRQISRLLVRFNRDISNILKIPSRVTRNRVLPVWYKEAISTAHMRLGAAFIHQGIEISFLESIISTRFKRAMEESAEIENRNPVLTIVQRYA